MDEWALEHWPCPRWEDRPDGYLVHVSPDEVVTVYRSKPSGGLWCCTCTRNSREGCAHLTFVVAVLHRRRT